MFAKCREIDQGWRKEREGERDTEREKEKERELGI